MLNNAKNNICFVNALLNVEIAGVNQSIFWRRMQSYLCEYKYSKNYMNAPFQRLNEQGFVKELKKDERKLQQDAQQPEAGQLWNLPDKQNNQSTRIIFILTAALHTGVRYVGNVTSPFHAGFQRNRDTV